MTTVKCLPIPAFEEHERFLKRIFVDRDTGCWNWTAFKNKAGYGTFGITGKMYDTKKYFAHRVSFSIFKKEIEEGLDVDHVCMNKSCVNPDHLREVNRKININENVTGKSAGFMHRNKTHCSRGHEYSEENIFKTKDGRDCRLCQKIRSREYRKTPAGIMARKKERENMKNKLNERRKHGASN